MLAPYRDIRDNKDMSMPNKLILVRHGHSEGNLAVDLSKQGDDSFYTPDFRERPGHQWRLTDEGRDQARQAGAWILQNIGEFDRYYVSPYIRTKETAALLDLPNAKWRIDSRLRERDWGDIGSLPRKEFLEEYPRNAFIKNTDSLYWRPPGGESIMDVRMRMRSLLDTLHREMADQRVLIVTHGEFMWSARAELEYMSDEEWLSADKDPSQKIHNTQVIEYRRSDPHTGEQDKYVRWVRSICPWMKHISFDWTQIDRKRFSNEDLLTQVNKVSPLI